MKGRLAISFLLLAIAVVACAGPDLVGSDDAIQESESVTDDTGSDNAPINREATDEDQPAVNPGEDTTPTTGNESPLVTNPPKETPSTATTSPASGGGTVDPSLAPFVDQAKMDLAERLGVDAGAIALISAELVEWSDASLGCPEPDMVYAQIPTDGSLIVLSHGGAAYHYHTGGNTYVPFLCEK